jgi:hypothetical protein
MINLIRYYYHRFKMTNERKILIKGFFKEIHY